MCKKISLVKSLQSGSGVHSASCSVGIKNSFWLKSEHYDEHQISVAVKNVWNDTSAPYGAFVFRTGILPLLYSIILCLKTGIVLRKYVYRRLLYGQKDSGLGIST
jgi:hypothetical protein